MTNRARQFGLTVADSSEEIELNDKLGIVADINKRKFNADLLRDTTTYVHLSLHAMHLALSELVTVVREQPDN